MGNLDAIIPLYSKMTPLDKGDNARDYVIKSLASRDVKPSLAFRMADIKS
jgi:hypothetical protein